MRLREPLVTGNDGLLSNVVSTTNQVKSSKPSGLSASSLLAAASFVEQPTMEPATVGAPLNPMGFAQGRSDQAPAAVDALFGSKGSGVDLMDLLVDDRLLPVSPKRHGRISAVDLALDEIVTMPFDDAFVNDLAMALV